MNIAELQTALNARNAALHLQASGIAGQDTLKAVDALVVRAVDVGDFAIWPDSRRLVAAEQIILRDAGIAVGTVDGLVGEQTRYARTVWSGRQALGGKPDPDIENWRDKPDVGPAPATTNAHLKWPRQADVAKFYGAVGEHQVTLELPFPMRIAWDLEKEVHRFSCHAKVKEAMFRIWKNTLDHYGFDKIVALRLNMYGGCLNVRKMRGGSAWSMHSWGIAEDVDPDRNQLNFHKAQATLDNAEYAAFWGFVYAEGALSLGRERDYDWMHFQFTRDFS